MLKRGRFVLISKEHGYAFIKDAEGKVYFTYLKHQNGIIIYDSGSWMMHAMSAEDLSAAKAPWRGDQIFFECGMGLLNTYYATSWTLVSDLKERLYNRTYRVVQAVAADQTKVVWEGERLDEYKLEKIWDPAVGIMPDMWFERWSLRENRYETWTRCDDPRPEIARRIGEAA